MTDNSIADPFGLIADEFVSEFRQGRRPSVDEFAQRFPEYADDIREILPTLVLMERVKSAADSLHDGAPRSQEAASLIGRELGDYRILREVGRGGMGIVYEAEQVSLGRHVALKVLPQHVLFDSKQRRRFDREAKAAARLHHTNIVPVFGVGEQDGLCYYVMQHIRGLGLDAVLDELRRLAQSSPTSAATSRGQLRVAKRPEAAAVQVAQALLSGEFPQSQMALEVASPSASVAPDSPQAGSPSADVAPAAAYIVADSTPALMAGSAPASSSQTHDQNYWQSIARLGIQAAEALQYAHDQGITHRDVKPSNLLLDLHGTLWVTDFGLAKSDDQQNLTHSGDILGTIRYLPPEAFDGKSDARSDVYSLGLTLYELLTLRPAFDDTDRRKLVKKVTTGEPPRIEYVNAEVPRDLATIIQKAIERDPADRYSTARQLADDLQRFVHDEPILARRASLREQASRWARHNQGLAAAMAGIVSLLVVLAVGATSAAVYYRRQEDRQRQLLEQAEVLASRNQQLAEDNRSALVSALDASEKLEIARTRAEDQEEITRRHLYFAQMSVAQKAWLSHRGLLRTELLLDAWRPNAGQPDLRGWEWYFILGLCHREQAALSGHAATVTCVAFSPAGTQLASASHDGVIGLWNPTTKQCEAKLTGHQGKVYSVGWNSTGTLLASAGDDGVKVWQADNGECLHTIPATSPVFSVAYSPNDQLLARSLYRGPLELWDTQSWERVGTLSGHHVDVYTQTISFSPDSQLLAAPARRETIVWDVALRAQRHVLKGHTGNCQAAVFSPDGTQLATSSRDATIKLWDVETGALQGTLTGHTHAVASLAWHPGGNRLATAAWDGTSRLWDVASRREQGIVGGHGRHVFSVAWNPAGDQLITGGDDRLIKLWTPTVAKESLLLADSADPLASLRYSADGALVITGDDKGKVALWDAHSGELLTQFADTARPVRGVDLHPEGTHVAAAYLGGSVVVWDRHTGEQRFKLEEHAKGAFSVTWDRSGKRLATTGLDGAVILWDAASGTLVKKLLGHAPGSVAAKFNSEGTKLASGGDDGTLRIWDLESGQTRVVAAHRAWVTDVAWSGDDSQIATCSDDHTVCLWDAASGERRRLLSGHSEAIATVAFSPDSQRLLSADRRSTVKLWDVATGIETLSLHGAIGQLFAADFSPDGMRIVANSDGRILVWDAQPGYALAEPLQHSIQPRR